jgi:hypothetical protein
VPYETLSAPKPAVLARAVVRCNKQLDRRGAFSRRLGVSGGPVKDPFTDGLVLSAVGGGYVGLISDAGGTQTFCVTAVRPNGYTPGGEGQGPATVAPGTDKLNSAGMGGFGALAGSLSYDFGRAGRNVSAVEYVFPHRRAVRGIVENGWYIALWPGDARTNEPASVRVTTRSGTISSPPPGLQCTRNPSSCAFVSQPRAPARTTPSPPPRTVSNPVGASLTLKQLLANFAILRRHQSAAGRNWKPPCDCGSTVQVRDLTRLAVNLPNDNRVFLDVKRVLAGSSFNLAAGSYLLSLDIVNRDGNSSSASFDSNGQYLIHPLSIGRFAGRGQSPLHPPRDSQVFASIVPDGVATVTWTVTVRCPKIASRFGAKCPATGSQAVTVPVTNNVAARMLPGVDSDPFYANVSRVVWRSRNGRVITSFNGYGNLPAPPFLSGQINSGTRRILSATGVAGAAIGEASAKAVQTLTSLIGAPAENVSVSGCGIDLETVWSSPSVADPLTLYQRAGRLVGYQYGAPPSQIGLVQGPGAVLATIGGLTLNTHISRARQLYPSGFATTSSPNLGRWTLTVGTAKLYGYAIPNYYPAHTVAGNDPVATIDAGNTGCQHQS